MLRLELLLCYRTGALFRDEEANNGCDKDGNLDEKRAKCLCLANISTHWYE